MGIRQEAQEIDFELEALQELQAEEEAIARTASQEVSAEEASAEQAAISEEAASQSDPEALARVLGQGFTGMIGVRQPEASAFLESRLGVPSIRRQGVIPPLASGFRAPEADIPSVERGLIDPEAEAARNSLFDRALARNERSLAGSEERVGLVNEIALKAIPSLISLPIGVATKIPLVGRAALQAGLFNQAETPLKERDVLTAPVGAITGVILQRLLGGKKAFKALEQRNPISLAKAVAEEGDIATKRDIESIILRAKAAGATAMELRPGNRNPLLRSIERLTKKNFFKSGDVDFDVATGRFKERGKFGLIPPSREQLLERAGEAIDLTNNEIKNVIDQVQKKTNVILRFEQLSGINLLQQNIKNIESTTLNPNLIKGMNAPVTQLKKQLSKGSKLSDIQRIKQQLGREMKEKDFFDAADGVKAVKRDIYGILKSTIEDTAEGVRRTLDPNDVRSASLLDSIKELNQTESAALKITGALERAIGKDRGVSGIPIKQGLAFVAGEMVTGSLGAATAVAALQASSKSPRAALANAASRDFMRSVGRSPQAALAWIQNKFPTVAKELEQNIAAGKMKLPEALAIASRMPLITDTFKENKESFSFNELTGLIEDPDEKRLLINEILNSADEDSVNNAKKLNDLINDKPLK